MRPRPWQDHLPGRSVEPPTGTLVARWLDRWRHEPGSPVLFQVADAPGTTDPGGDTGRWVSAGEIDERSAGVAARLSAAGVAPGDRVLWVPSSSVAGIVAHVAALRAGAVVVPVNPASAERELEHVVAEVDAVAALVAPVAAAGVVGRSGVALVLDVHRLGSGGAPFATGDAPPVAPGGDSPALVAFTSGTTGAPKGAVLSHANVLANSWALALAWGVDADDRLVHALPLFHGHGLCAGLYTMLLAGSSTVLLPGFEVTQVTDAVARHRASLFFGVPTMYHRLLRDGGVEGLRGLRLAVSGSAPLAPELHGSMATRGLSVLERYGMTETLLTISNPLHGERRPGTVGFPLPGVDVEVDDASGEILVRGAQVFSGYFGRAAATAESFTGGFFRTGDIAEVDDGYVRILGRARDLIISGGFNVYPAEVEDVLLRHPQVGEVAVTGTPSEEWGEVVTAWIVPAGDAVDEDAVRSFAAAELAPYKRPRLVRVVDRLPRNAMGKVQRAELR